MQNVSKNPTIIHDEYEFRRIIQREHHRTNRYGKRFSCIVFKTDYAKESTASNRKLIEAIASRIRSVDETGWYNHTEIGVLLVGADTESAKKVALDVVDRVSPKNPSPPFSIYSHTSF
jgi:hypothetical protein